MDDAFERCREYLRGNGVDLDATPATAGPWVTLDAKQGRSSEKFPTPLTSCRGVNTVSHSWYLSSRWDEFRAPLRSSASVGVHNRLPIGIPMDYWAIGPRMTLR